MRLRISIPYLIAFTLLLLVMLEFHEMVHISVGRIICGCWGPRDFNVWALCAGCESQPFSWLATLAGPVFSFLMMWIGMFWLSSDNAKKQAIGFSLIFANFPLGRITTVMMGGGDEMVVVRNFLSQDYSRTQMIWVGTVILLAVGLPPVILAYRVVINRMRWLYILGFLTLPLLFLMLYVLGALNSLLNVGFLQGAWIMGTPLLITLHTLAALILLILWRRNLFDINVP